MRGADPERCWWPDVGIRGGARRAGLVLIRPAARIFLFALLLSGFAVPAASRQEGAPTHSTFDRFDDRRYVVTGERAYVVGTQAGRFPAMGFHTRGEMGGVWAPRSSSSTASASG